MTIQACHIGNALLSKFSLIHARSKKEPKIETVIRVGKYATRGIDNIFNNNFFNF